MKKPKKQQPKKTPRPGNANSQYEELAHYFNLANVCLAQGKLGEAQKNYLTVLALKADFAEAHNNLGVVLQQQGKIEQAIERHQRAIALKPKYPQAYHNLGLAFRVQKKFALAIESYRKALAFDPDYIAAIDDLFRTQLVCCDWSDFSGSVQKIRRLVSENKPGLAPLEFFSISDSLAEQQKCAHTFAANNIVQPKNMPWETGRPYQHDKIRIAYVSADFGIHPVSYLTAGLFEQHDRKRFEITAISLRPEDSSEIGQRIKSAFDRFIDVSNMSNSEIAALVRELEIDIAVDLMGFTGNSRTGVFAQRAAPVQISYLGYPGTMGVDFIDYIIGDKWVIPVEQQTYFNEKVVYLPDSYFVNDDKRAIAAHTPSRAEANLPATGFVFCCFNAHYKITPEIFSCWMRLLNKIKDSVLWLSTGDALVISNLRKEAASRSVSAERLIFAERQEDMKDHLARQRLADLFLDTLPYNAHTTSCDALWAGLPVLTCLGNAFAGRVAGSLLNAIGLPELITHNLEEYENLAFKLATTPALLTEIRAKLAKNRSTYPLFNTGGFCRHIEAAYLEMWQRQQRGELPNGFSVEAIE